MCTNYQRGTWRRTFCCAGRTSGQMTLPRPECWTRLALFFIYLCFFLAWSESKMATKNNPEQTKGHPGNHWREGTSCSYRPSNHQITIFGFLTTIVEISHWSKPAITSPQNEASLGPSHVLPFFSYQKLCWRSLITSLQRKQPLQTKGVGWKKSRIIHACRRKFRSQTSDNMGRWKAGVEQKNKEEKSRREKIREEKESKKVQVRVKVGKSQNIGKTMICGSRGSKSRLAKAAGAEPAAGQMRDEKLHAVVARSAFPSQNVQNTSAPDFWSLLCF